jgi:hypothetical protein
MKQQPDQNLALWLDVEKTDPSQTKQFTRGGGFKGTAIKPYWLMKRATETFGPCGIGWGWEEIENKYLAGVWCSKVRLWYQWNNQRGSLEQWGQTQMEGKNKNGDFVDEEAPKKAVTDAVTKCLSYLGFAGDVHMGMFDDSKYVEERKKEEEGRKKEETAKARNEKFAAVKAALAESDDPAVTWHDNLAAISEFKAQDQQFYDDLVATAKARKETLAKSGEAAGTGNPAKRKTVDAMMEEGDERYFGV